MSRASKGGGISVDNFYGGVYYMSDEVLSPDRIRLNFEMCL
jgi:hypothetical protein